MHGRASKKQKYSENTHSSASSKKKYYRRDAQSCIPTVQKNNHSFTEVV
ncbi:MAG: hypothetical protein N4A49_10020 [Marinifilaceae bacterium]|jgi:hypothetical protein|nr:hypothetical protein [Marinifilaceae bacterium]